jgi:hypothetical protein
MLVGKHKISVKPLPFSRKDLNLGVVLCTGSRIRKWNITFSMMLSEKGGYLPFISPATGSSGLGVYVGKIGNPIKIFLKIKRMIKDIVKLNIKLHRAGRNTLSLNEK